MTLRHLSVLNRIPVMEAPMQTRLRLWHRWERQVRAIWPTVRVTQTRVLAYFVFGLVLTGEIALQRVATAWPVAARDPSRERRLRRWLANPRIDPGRLWQQALPILLATLGPTPLFVFDPTPHRADWTRLELGVVVHKRVLPVAWRLVPQQRDWPQRLPALVGPMLAAVQAALPPGCTPTLLVDRGLTSPTLLDQGRALGWHVVMRLKTGPWGAHRVRLGDDETRVWSLVRRPGQRWTGAVALFKDAGWRPVQLTIYWEHGYDAPWLLVSDDLVGSAAVRAFRRRAQVEAAYEDGKSRGW